MATDNYVRSYGDVSRVDDVVLNAVEILTAEENQIFNAIGKTMAKDEVHSYLVDTLRTPGTATLTQGNDYSYEARTTPTRLTNIVEEMGIPFVVTQVQRDIQHYHGQDELERQTMKALKDFANAVEFTLVRQTLTSGASGTASTMSGIIEAISKSTNTTSHTSGTTLNSSHLDGLMKENWDNSNGDVATDLHVGSYLRNAIDGFTQKTNVVVNAPGISSIVRTVSTYETAFGTLRLKTHRYIQQSGDATGRLLATRPEKLKFAFLRKPFVDNDIARTGPADKKAIYASGTLEVRNQDSNWFTDGFNIG